MVANLVGIWLVALSLTVHAQEDSSRAAPVVSKSPRGLPSVPSVESMIKGGDAVDAYLAKTPTTSAFEQSEKTIAQRTRTRSSESSEEVQWDGGFAGWTEPAFYTRPLYFEQINFERYETNAPAWTRPALSYAQFLGTIPVLPYKIGANGPRERAYSVGHYPYGHGAARHKSILPLSKRGVLYQGAATTGLVFLVP